MDTCKICCTCQFLLHAVCNRTSEVSCNNTKLGGAHQRRNRHVCDTLRTLFGLQQMCVAVCLHSSRPIAATSSSVQTAKMPFTADFNICESQQTDHEHLVCSLGRPNQSKEYARSAAAICPREGHKGTHAPFGGPIDAVGEHFLGYYRTAGEFLSGEFLGSLNSNLFY